MNVPFVDLASELANMRADIDAAIKRVLDSTRFIGGPEVAAFEQALAEATGVQSVVGVSSGTDALLVCLMALDLAPGDEVITTPFSFFATVGAIVRVGATPMFADVEPNSLNIDPRGAEAAITERTKVILPVHLFGRPAALQATTGVEVLEDAAQAVGVAPPAGIAATASFFPTKNLGAIGDAGAVLSNDAQFASRVRLLREHGARPKYVHPALGGNFRLDAVQAAVLRTKLPYLASFTQSRRRNAARYRRLFGEADIDFELHLPMDHPQHMYNQFVVRTPHRDALRTHLEHAGIVTAIYYPLPLHLQPCLRSLGYRRGAFPHAEAAADEVLALPIHPFLSAGQQEHVVDTVRRFSP